MILSYVFSKRKGTWSMFINFYFLNFYIRSFLYFIDPYIFVGNISNNTL